MEVGNNLYFCDLIIYASARGRRGDFGEWAMKATVGERGDCWRLSD